MASWSEQPPIPLTLSSRLVTKMKFWADAGFAPTRVVSTARSSANGPTNRKRDLSSKLDRDFKELALGRNRPQPCMDIINSASEIDQVQFEDGATPRGESASLWGQVWQIPGRRSIQERSGKGRNEVRVQGADCTKFNLQRSRETGEDA